LTHGELHASAPCWHCMHAIQRCPRIKRIIYSESDGSITRCSPDNLCTQHVSCGMRGERRFSAVAFGPEPLLFRDAFDMWPPTVATL
jgi:hypothetical protein